MRISVLALSLLLSLSFSASAAEDVGSTVSTDDICAVRPELCDSTASRHKRKKKRQARDLDFADFDADAPKGKVKKTARKKKSNDPLADFWERGQEEINEPLKPLDLDRGPSSIIKPAAIAPAPPAVRRRITFASYLNANSGNSALSSGYRGRQDAFQQVIRPATITDPSANASDGTSGTGQSLREPASIQPSSANSN